MKTIQRIAVSLMAVGVLLIGAVFLLAGVDAGLDLLAGLAAALGLSGGSIGLAIVVGPVTELTTPEDHKVRDVSDFLTVDQPDKVPLIKLLRAVEKAPRLTAAKAEWEEDAEIPIRDTANGGESAGGAGASVNLTVHNIGYWRLDDTIMLPHNSTAPGAILHVVGFNSTSDIQVVRVDGGSASAWGTVPAIANDELLVRIGNTKKEFFQASAYRTTMPLQYFNYVEQFDAVIGASRLRMHTKNYTKDDWLRSKDRQKFDYERGINNKLWFGRRELKIIDNERKGFTGGVLGFNLPKGLGYFADDFTESDLISWTRQIFAGNSGARKRYLFADSVLMEDLMGIHLNKVRRTQVESKTLRMEIENFVTGFGEVRCIYEPAFDEAGKERFGVCLDLEQIRLRHLIPPTVTPLNLKKTQGADGVAHQIDEALTLEVRYLKTHATIQGAATS